MKLYDFLQLSVCVFSVLAAGFWLQSATNRVAKLASKASWQGRWCISTSANEPVAMECSGSRVCWYGGFFSIGCSGAAIRRPKLIHGSAGDA